MVEQATSRIPGTLVRQWMEDGWNRQRDEAVEACFAADFVGHDAYQPPLHGHADVRSFVHGIRSAFGDLSIRVDDVLVEGDRAATRITVRARHTGEFLGHAATGASLTFPALIIFRLQGGLFREAWQHWDVAGVVRAIREVSRGDLTGFPETDLGGDLGQAPPTRQTEAAETVRNKQLVRYWLDEAWNRHRIGVVDEVIGKDFLFHDANAPVMRGQDGMREWVRGLDEALQDISLSVDDLVAEGDKVACRLSFEAVHKGDLFGVRPTGEKIRSGALFIVQMTDGRFRAAWQVWDLFRVLQQLAVVA